MNEDLLKTLPARQGHFLLESGYHTANRSADEISPCGNHPDVRCARRTCHSKIWFTPGNQ
jgi:hypothetical protein